MDLRQLRYFAEVAEVGGFNEAAARLNVSQSSISRRVRDLELELGVSLFERDPAGARLTASGRNLLERANVILRQVELARLEAIGGSREPMGTVALGLSPACAQLFISPLMKRVASALPGVHLQFVEGAQCALLDAVETGKADLALVVSPGVLANHAVRRLPPEELQYVCREPQGEGPIDISRLTGVPLVLFPRPSGNRDYLDKAAALSGFELRVAYEINDLSVQKQLIRDGSADGILPYSAVHEEVRRGEFAAMPIRGLFISRAIVWKRNRDLLPSVEAVANCVESTVSGAVADVAALKHAEGGKAAGSLPAPPLAPVA